MQPARLAGVQFHPVGKIYHFDVGGFPAVKKGDYVIVETARGRHIAKVVSLGPPSGDAALEAVKPIERMATGRDMALHRYWRGKEAETAALCRETAARLGLPIKIIAVEYSFDGARLTVVYTAEDKVDTLQFKQEIGGLLRARVELKLVGPRDVAKILGGYGACGELRCCSQFLTDFSSISIKMAKEQDISLSPQEITGMCGRLRCCLEYEYKQYVEARQGLPRRGKEIGTRYGRGVVVDVLPLKGAVLVRVDEKQIEVALEDIVPLSDTRPVSPHAGEPVGAQETPLAQPQEPGTPAPDGPEPAGRERQKARRRSQQTKRKERAPRPGPQKPDSSDKKNEPSAQRRKRRKKQPAESAQ